jgi:predicted nuclease of predicted toxin-antitoxin system
VIRFLLDMGVAQSTGEFLNSFGHDAVHLRDQGLQRLPDEQIVEKAQEEGRTIVTHDLDFGRIVALSGGTVPSIVTLRLINMTPAQVNIALQTVLNDAAQSLEQGALVTITDSGIRIRRLPIDED